LADFEYPLNNAENVYLSPRWLAAPVQVPNSIANCYINGTGVVDFTDDPPWDQGWGQGQPPYHSVAFHLRFISHFPAQPGDSPLTPGDIVVPGSVMATVGLSHIDHDIEGAPTEFEIALFSVDIAAVAKGDTELDITVNGQFMGDAWIDRIAYEIDMLVYHPEFDQSASGSTRWAGRRIPDFFQLWRTKPQFRP
jgi:hypothetical protein